MNLKAIISKGLIASTFSINFFLIIYTQELIKLNLCFLFRLSPCRVTVSNTHIESNLPTDYLYVDKDNFLDLKVYEDLGKSSNLVVGTVSTLLLGPVGLLGFLVKKKSGTIDYAVSFKGERGRTKTAFIRFKNMKAAAAMGEELPELLKNISGKESNQQ